MNNLNTKGIARSTVIRLTGNFLNLLLTFYITVIIVRYLGKEEYGRYALVFAYLYFFRPLVDLGLLTVLVREIARDRKNAGKYLGNAIVVQIPIAILVFILSILII